MHCYSSFVLRSMHSHHASRAMFYCTLPCGAVRRPRLPSSSDCSIFPLLVKHCNRMHHKMHDFLLCLDHREFIIFPHVNKVMQEFFCAFPATVKESFSSNVCHSYGTKTTPQRRCIRDLCEVPEYKHVLIIKLVIRKQDAISPSGGLSPSGG